MAETNFQIYLKEQREKIGLSQKAVATRLGYGTPQFISNWERGLSTPPIKCLKKIAAMYEIDSEDLFERLLSQVIEDLTFDLKKKIVRSKPK